MSAKIHVSDMQAFLQCRRKWNWSSALRSNLTPIEMYEPFVVGRMVHFCLEQMTGYGVTVPTALGSFLKQEVARMTAAHQGALFPGRFLWEGERNQLREYTIFVRRLMEHYRLWLASYRGPFQESDLEYLSTEKIFLVPLRTGEGSQESDLWFEGRLDGLVRHKKDGSLWIAEYKTARSIKERLGMLPYEMQASAYCVAAEQMLGEPVAGVLYTLFRKKLPSSPEVLRSGMLSQNKAIDTTYEHYLACIRRHHGQAATKTFILTHYGPFLQQLRGRAEDSKYAFFQRVAIRRTPGQLAQFTKEFWQVARQMADAEVPIYASPGYHCAFCSFKEPCLEVMQGLYPDETLDLLFTQRPDDYQNVVPDFASQEE